MFARYAKYIGYYTPMGEDRDGSEFARYAKYIGYYTQGLILKLLMGVC